MAPGSHVLELTSLLGGAESSRSERLTVIVSSSTNISGLVVEPSPQGVTPGVEVCVVAYQRECYDTHVVASALGTVTSLSPGPDNRLWFVEDGRRVRLIAGGVLIPADALAVSDTEQITGLTIDRNFETSRLVLVALTEDARASRRLVVTRYRELQNTLGEGATIAVGWNVPADTLTPLAVDGDGLLYVAVGDDSDSPSRTGAVLRLDRDGLVPASNPRSSPVIAEGYRKPVGLVVDLVTRRVWQSGSDQDRLGISHFPIPSGTQALRPVRPPIGQGLSTTLALATEGKLFRVQLAANGSDIKVQEIRLPDGYDVREATATQDGLIYCSISIRSGPIAIVRLTPH